MEPQPYNLLLRSTLDSLPLPKSGTSPSMLQSRCCKLGSKPSYTWPASQAISLAFPLCQLPRSTSAHTQLQQRRSSLAAEDRERLNTMCEVLVCLSSTFARRIRGPPYAHKAFEHAEQCSSLAYLKYLPRVDRLVLKGAIFRKHVDRFRSRAAEYLGILDDEWEEVGRSTGSREQEKIWTTAKLSLGRRN